MNTVLSLVILLSQNTLKRDNTYIISKYIIEHINEMKDKSIKQFSEECFTSTTSIIKYCQLLGFESYSAFKRQLLSTFETRKLQLIEKHNLLKIDDLLKQVQSLSSQEIDRDVLLDKIDQVVEMIIENKIVHFYGAVFPLQLTLSFIEDMLVMGIPSFVHQIPYGDYELEHQEGIHIIITLSGRYIQTNKNEYKQICSLNNNTVLISQETEYIGNVLINIPLPKTDSSDYSELIFLLILDIIKLKIYNHNRTSQK